MFRKVALLILLTRFPYKTSASRVCVPNTQTLLNGKICTCNSTGHWIEAGCQLIARRHVCKPGQVIVQGCSRCICQETGQLTCTGNASCSGPHPHQNVQESLTAILPWCNPFRTYYINCNICICPASGKSLDAQCALDISCSKEPSKSEMASKTHICIPKVMYLFPCLHCLCSEDGYFNLDKCIETCVRKQSRSSRRCIPKSIYRKDCNVCFCPDDGIPDTKLCTNTTCTHPVGFGTLRYLKNKHKTCTPHEFTKPKCMYCDCNHSGKVDERSCLEHECLRYEGLKYDTDKETCSPGEMASYCLECLCPRNGFFTSDEFCSNACSYQSKLRILEDVMVSPKNKYIVDKEAIERVVASDTCNPRSIYIEKGRYCLCPDTGNTNFKLCTTPDKNIIKPSNKSIHFRVSIDFNVTCEPSTFVEFDCNTCVCSKQGKIDPKWCSYDDCESKQIIQESYNIHPTASHVEPISNNCSPGSLTNVDCNFCICSESGLMADRVCTKNDCSSFTTPHDSNANDKFACDPLAYYEVDCNICFCPRDGVKNVAKCTKNHCEKSFLRSDVCIPGQLFSDECNVCVCPPNGNKAERACTNYTCADSAPWKKIFQLSESLLGNHITEDSSRNLDHCFPGEEYVAGCKLCMCPDMGLRVYATCSPTFCDEDRRNIEGSSLTGSNRDFSYRKLNTRREDCMVINFTSSMNRNKCTPGSMYIIRCKQCICPYMGEMSYFCRPLPKDVYCEQPFPGYNYLPMGRRGDNSSADLSTGNTTSQKPDKDMDRNLMHFPTGHLPILVKHDHTRYECKKVGQVKDACFVCECDGETLIREHCYQSNSTQCADAKPSFLEDMRKKIGTKETKDLV